MNEMHEEWEKEDHTKGRKQPLGRRSSGEGEEVEWKVFGKEKRDFLSREIGEKWNEIRVESIYRNTKLDGSRAIKNLSTAKEPQWIDRASIKQTETVSMDQESVKKLLSQNQESCNGSRLR